MSHKMRNLFNINQEKELLISTQDEFRCCTTAAEYRDVADKCGKLERAKGVYSYDFARLRDRAVEMEESLPKWSSDELTPAGVEQ